MTRWLIALALVGCSQQRAAAPIDSHSLDARSPTDAAGSAWHAETSGVTTSLRGVWAASSSDVYVVGQGGSIVHSTGDGNWSPQTSGTTQDLYAIWGSGPNDIYAVGDVLLHSTGDGTWQSQTAPTALMGVWGSSSTDVYVAGSFGVSHSAGDGQWTAQTQAEQWGGYFHVRGSGSGDVYALGGLINLASNSAPGGGVATLSAGQWSWTQLSPGDEMKDIAFTSRGEFIVGLSGQIWARSGDSGAWTQQQSPSLGDIQGIWADDNGQLYAVAQTDGAVITSSGDGNWTVQASLGVYDLWGIGGSGSQVYVVGDNGSIIHFMP